MISLIVDGIPRDYSDLSFSSVDPGGYEQASFTCTGGPRIRPGDEVRIFEGTETAWHGRVEEPGFQLLNGISSNQVNAVGYGVKLRAEPFSMVYIESSLQDWVGPGNLRSAQLLAVSRTPYGCEVKTDDANGLPCLSLSFVGAWVQAPQSEGWYDAGYNNKINRVFYSWDFGNNVNVATSDWESVFVFCSDDVGSSTFGQTGDLQTVGDSGSSSLSVGIGSRYLLVYFINLNATFGGDGTLYNINFPKLVMLGDHTLQPTTTGSTTYLKVSEIAEDVIRRSGSNFDMQIASSDQMVTQFVYKTPTEADQMIEELNSILGWHWGVWAPSSLASSTPLFVFQPPPQTNTCVGFVSDCDEFDITQSYSRLNNRILLSYTDIAGKTKYVDYSNPGFDPIVGDETHTLQLNVGVSTDDAAQIMARFILTLDRADSRVSGTCILPQKVIDGRWSHLLRPGIDKIRFPDMPTMSSLIDDPPTRNDTFRISRLNVTVRDGKPSTSIEFDQGANLIEVLQARIAQGNTRVGF